MKKMTVEQLKKWLDQFRGTALVDGNLAILKEDGEVTDRIDVYCGMISKNKPLMKIQQGDFYIQYDPTNIEQLNFAQELLNKLKL